MHKSMLVTVLTYGSGTMMWKEEERSRIRAVQIDSLRGLLGIRRKDKVPNLRIRELCGETKGVDEKTDGGVLRWFGHVERMENRKITGFLRETIKRSVLVVAQWVGRETDGLIP